MGNSFSDEAINLAVQGRWDEAVLVNQRILEVSPNDIDTLNRLGKALSEVNRISESRDAYRKVLEVDPHNAIAHKNLERLARLEKSQPIPREPRGIDSQFFIEETSKARRVTLQRLASRDILGKMAAGDPVRLIVSNSRLQVENELGEYLGEVDPKIGARLVRLMQGGNEYKAAVINLDSDQVYVIIRETFRHPTQKQYPSFPPPRTIEEIRPYLKDSMVKREIEEDPLDDGDEGEDGVWPVEDKLLEDDVAIEDDSDDTD